MHTKLALMTLAAFVGLLHSAQAAPIQALAYIDLLDVKVSGLSGEIYISLRGPEELLDRSAALNIPGATKDNFVPGEVTYLNLGGFNGAVNMGKVIKPSLSLVDFDDFRFAYQTSFTSPIVELTPQIGTFGFVPPPGVEGFWFVSVPEPTSIALAGFSLLGLAARRRMSVRSPS
jgi:hypothetical protein